MQCHVEAQEINNRGEMTSNAYIPGNLMSARNLNNLAQVLQATNRLAEAEPLMRRALAIVEVSFAPDHLAIALSRENLTALL